MKTETSAGGVVVRKRRGVWEVLMVRDMSDRWTFPKGKVEKGEDFIHAAEREVSEEVGITDIHLLIALPVTRYIYARKVLISKTVRYFLFSFEGTEKLVSQTEEGIHDASWMPLTKAVNMIGYPKTNIPLLSAARTYLHT